MVSKPRVTVVCGRARRDVAAASASPRRTRGGARASFSAYLIELRLLPRVSPSARCSLSSSSICTRAGWSVVVRRFAEAVACNVWFMAVLRDPDRPRDGLYHWTESRLRPTIRCSQQGGYPQPSLLHHPPGALFRDLECAGELSPSQLASPGREAGTLRPTRTDGASRALRACVLFALTITFAAIDLLMSLDPHWFSTIFGVYYFAGGGRPSSPCCR